MLDKASRPGKPIAAGDTFAVPLGDGRFGAVRVLRTVEDEEGTAALVAVTPWIGDHVPDRNEPLLKQILQLHRGHFKGKPALRWYDGEPPDDFVYLGVIPPTETELAIDPRGRYGGYWHPSMARDVVLELEWGRREKARAPQARGRVDGDVDRVTGVMSEDEFWRVIELLDWEAGNDDRIVERVVQHLAGLAPEKIAGFHRVLCEKLHQLDREEFAREIGEYSYGSPEGFSPDHFLDARCAVVANGKESYEEVLSDPHMMPKNREFEVLLTVAEKAYRRRTGRTPLFLGAKEYETFSSTAGWDPLNS